MLLGNDEYIGFYSLCEKLEALNNKYCSRVVVIPNS